MFDRLSTARTGLTRSVYMLCTAYVSYSYLSEYLLCFNLTVVIFSPFSPNLACTVPYFHSQGSFGYEIAMAAIVIFTVTVN